MKLLDLDIPLLEEHVRKLAESEPQRHAVCRYFSASTGQAICIVGHAMALQGFGFGDLKAIQSDTGPYNGESFTRMMTDIGVDSALVDWIGDVQCNQDGGMGWAEAVRAADKS